MSADRSNCADYRGHVENGIIRPDEPLDLPDGTPVNFHPASPPDARDVLSRQLWENAEPPELLSRSSTQPLRTLDELAGDWPPEDDIDEFLQFLREIRE